MKTSETLQIEKLLKQGASPGEIAEGFGFDLQAVEFIASQMGSSKKQMSLAERFGNLQEIAISALINTIQTTENDGARVMASKILLDEHHTSGKTGFCYDELANAIAQSQARVQAIDVDSEVVSERIRAVEDLNTRREFSVGSNKRNECRELQVA